MKINKRVYIFLVLSFILVVLFSNNIDVYAEKSMDIQRVNIEAEILKDGTMVVNEYRTIYFEGQYNGFYQNLKLDRGVSITDIKVSENGTPYQYNPGTEYGSPGTYLTKDEGNSILVDWSINADNESRTFLL